MSFDALTAILLVPALAAGLLATLPGYRLTARLNVLASLLTFLVALSVVLLGLLMMVTRRNAVSQVVGFMSLENGLVLAATGAKGMPLVVEISIAFSILIAFIVIGIGSYLAKLAVGGVMLAIFEASIAKMRVFRVPQFLGAALMLGLLATLLRFVSGSM